MAHPSPMLGRPIRKAHEKGGVMQPAMKTYKALPSMKYEKRKNVDRTQVRETLVAPILRAPTAAYLQLNPSVREGRVLIDWSGRSGPVPRRTDPGMTSRNRQIKKFRKKAVA